MAVHQLCPRPSPTACSYIWLSFSNLPSPTMLILLKSLLAVSILHLFIPKPSPFLSMWACYSLYWHTPFSHTQRAHLYSTTFYPRFSLCKTFIISILHLCPQSQQSEINFYPFSAKMSHSSGVSLTHSSMLLGPTKCTAHCRWVTSTVCCDLYFYPPVPNKCREMRAERSTDSWSSLLFFSLLRSTLWEELTTIPLAENSPSHCLWQINSNCSNF